MQALEWSISETPTSDEYTAEESFVLFNSKVVVLKANVVVSSESPVGPTRFTVQELASPTDFTEYRLKTNA